MSARIRPATDDERERYIASTWTASWFRARRSGRATIQRTASILLATQSVLVRTMPGTEGRLEDVAGWICYTPLRTSALVHYVYVRADRRREGIGRALLEAAGVDVRRTVLIGCYTKDGEHAAREAGLRTERTDPMQVVV